jgi:hypothetical protein
VERRVLCGVAHPMGSQGWLFLLGSKYVLKTTSMHQPKVGAGTSILLVAYIGSYLPFSIPSLHRCNTCKETTIVKGTIVVLLKGTTRLAKGTTIVTLG